MPKCKGDHRQSKGCNHNVILCTQFVFGVHML
jgi:hypothetical protein